jgi:hypothetical protein
MSLVCRPELGLIELNLFGEPGLLCDARGTLLRPDEDPNYALMIVRMGIADPADVFYRDPYYEDP